MSATPPGAQLQVGAALTGPSAPLGCQWRRLWTRARQRHWRTVRSACLTQFTSLCCGAVVPLRLWLPGSCLCASWSELRGRCAACATGCVDVVRHNRALVQQNARASVEPCFLTTSVAHRRTAAVSDVVRCAHLTLFHVE
ncbi:hypothetical protein TRVL_09669 [Trypanosoma vivax]|nr:hypothetical protein TRVL_09669 [Trypanosoma vivax]